MEIEIEQKLLQKSLENITNAHSANQSELNFDKLDVVSNYQIPSRYFKNRFVILPIDPDNSFVYWEVTDEKLKEIGIDILNVNLDFVVCDELDNVFAEFSSSFAVGDFYIKHQKSFKAIYGKLVAQIDGKQVEILRSNIVNAFEPTIKYFGDGSDFAKYQLLNQAQKERFNNLENKATTTSYSSKDLL